MKKQLLCLLCVLMVAAMTALPASAQAFPTETTSIHTEAIVSSFVSEGVGDSTAPNATNGVGDTGDETALFPFEIKYEKRNDTPVIIKSFRVPAGTDPMSLVEEDFTEDGFLYSKDDILKSEPEVLTSGKTVAESVVFSTEDNEQATILAALNPIIEYNEGGYTGQLMLDYDSITSSVAGKESYSYPIRKTVDVSHLADNDYAYLDKNMNGLTLEEADWDLHNGVQRADTMIPGWYAAQATYTGTGYGTKVTSYTNTANYTGYVTCTTQGDAVYSILYKGIKDPAQNVIPWVGIASAIGLMVLVGAAGFVVCKGVPKLRHRNRADTTPPPVEVPQ